MVIVQLVARLIKPRLRCVLSLAEMNMNTTQFQRFKKELFREFGGSGLIRDLEKELLHHGKERSGTSGMGRNTLAGKEVPK